MAGTRSRSSRLRKADEGDLWLVDEILNHPRNVRWYGRADYTRFMEFTETYIWDDSGVFCFERLSLGVVRVHVAFKPKAKDTTQAAREMLTTIQHKIMLANIPSFNRAAQRYARRMGFEHYGQTPNMKQYIRRNPCLHQ